MPVIPATPKAAYERQWLWYHRTKLTPRDVRKIRYFLSKGFTGLEIAEWYNVEDSIISLIKRNKRWWWVK